MKTLAEIDKNFKVETSIQKDDIKFIDANDPIFKLYGVFYENGKYCRMSEAVASSVSEGVASLNECCAGGRVRFVTDSPYVAVVAHIKQTEPSPHSTFVGKTGMDLYVKRDGEEVHTGTFIPPMNTKDKYESIVDFGKKELREFTINMPPYNCIYKLYIGLSEDSIIKDPAPYINEKPVVYYGSSITQGACASRPGNNYQQILSRRLNIDYLNLGFSGNALAEDEMIDYIANLEMSVFVMDYDHNAPTIEHLEKTHEKMFKAIRNQNPDLPIIIMPRPRFTLTENEKKRLGIIKTTYTNAVNSGDKNVYFIDNTELCALCKNDGTVDMCHPNDLGFLSMANAVEKVLAKILKNT